MWTRKFRLWTNGSPQATWPSPKRAECWFAELVGSAAILVLASHSEEIVRRTCNKAVLLRQGMVAHVGDMDEVLHAYKRTK
jgi:ABC-type polysaccharide/polyol phosphate transport system ATPase subunit